MRICKKKPDTSPGNSFPVQILNNKSKKLIRIIENIPNNLQPRSSSDIKNRIKNTTTRKIPINYTYFLKKALLFILKQRKI